MKTFKQQVEEEANKPPAFFNNYEKGFKFGATFAARLIVEMLNDPIADAICLKTKHSTYYPATEVAEWLEKEIERES